MREISPVLGEITRNPPAVAANNPGGLERKRHRKFADYRVTREWFKDNAHIKAHINEVCVTA